MQNQPPLQANADLLLPPGPLKNLGAEMLQQLNDADNNILISKTANDWLNEAALAPVPQMLLSELWYEGEICVLFADTNVGKSILAVQIGNSISSGKPIPGFKLGVKAQPVVYFDFELNKKQFQNRYSDNYRDNFCFDANFIRVEINTHAPLLDGGEFEEAIKAAIRNKIVEHNARIIIVDNLTYLNSESEKSKEASALMKYLKMLKEELHLSMLALAHTPKRDGTQPITSNDCQGSKMLGNFCDSSFAIGKSFRGADMRYIKQVKQRTTAEMYGADNVFVCRINKASNFVQFEFMEHGSEQVHLKTMRAEESEALEQQIIELNNKGLSFRQIAQELSTSHMKVKRIIDNCNNL